MVMIVASPKKAIFITEKVWQTIYRNYGTSGGGGNSNHHHHKRNSYDSEDYLEEEDGTTMSGDEEGRYELELVRERGYDLMAEI
ncbi:hypothetical protein ACOSQ2_019751 [Xanthoceras sorbifolium]